MKAQWGAQEFELLLWTDLRLPLSPAHTSQVRPQAAAPKSRMLFCGLREIMSVSLMFHGGLSEIRSDLLRCPGHNSFYCNSLTGENTMPQTFRVLQGFMRDT
jgi:hypothetical protein